MTILIIILCALLFSLIVISYVFFIDDIHFGKVKSKKDFLYGLIPLGYIIKQAIKKYRSLPD